MKKNKSIFLLAGSILTIVFFVMALFFFGVFQYASITPYTDVGNLGDVESPFVSGQTVCQQRMGDNIQYVMSDVQKAECRRCDKADTIVMGQCALGCGEICPTNSNCRYPDCCPTGVCTNPDGSFFKRVSTGRDYWEGWAQGCTVSYERKAYATFIVWNSETLTSAETQFQTTCNASYNPTPIPPTGDVIVTPEPELPSASQNITCSVVCSIESQILDLNECKCVPKIAPVICQLSCGNNYVPDYENCICVRASSDTTLPPTETPSTGNPSIPKPYNDPNAKIYGAIFLLLAIVSLVFTIWQATKRK